MGETTKEIFLERARTTSVGKRENALRAIAGMKEVINHAHDFGESKKANTATKSKALTVGLSASIQDLSEKSTSQT